MTDALRLRLQAALGGAYVLDGELAGGGMSRVFVGRETALGRRIVLKVLPPEVATREPVARFQREAVLAARLQHPHIVPVFAVGEVDDIRFFTMPFIDGESLRARLERRRALPASEASRILREIGSALACVHRQDVVHRDVKPENIFIERGTERAMLADFGVALALGEPEGVTQVGVTVGTPAYMSPEQVDGHRVDGSSDIYSLGLVGWEMLAGERPWSGESFYDVMHKQKYELLRPLDAFRTDAAPSLVRAIDRAVRKDPAARWPSADAFVAAIDGKEIPAAGGAAVSPEWLADAGSADRALSDLHDGSYSDAAIPAVPHAASGANAPTIVARTRRSEGRSERRTSAGFRPSGVYTRRGGRRNATRWTRAVPAAIVMLLVGAAAVAGATGTDLWSLPSWIGGSGESVASIGAGAGDVSIPVIDTVAAIHVASRFTGIGSSVRGGTAAVTVLPAVPAPARLVHAPGAAPVASSGVSHAAHHLSRRYTHAQPGNSVRARVATAELSLHTYERIMATAPSVRDATSARSAPSAVPSTTPSTVPSSVGSPPLAPAIPSVPQATPDAAAPPAPAPADSRSSIAASPSAISAAPVVGSTVSSAPALAVRVPKRGVPPR